MSSDWREVTLEEVTTLLGDGLHGTPNYDDSGDYYFINGRNLSEGKIILDENTKRATEEEYLKHKKDLNDRTILVSINGTLGNIAFYNDENVFLGKSACYFNVNDEVEKDFIYYVLKNDVFQNHIDREATGTTIKNVSLKTMRGFSFKLPPLETQEKIVSILGSIDQKIYLNQQTNETLETMAQAIFKSWFVDFDPVRAKIEDKSAGRDPNRAAMAAIAGLDSFDEASKDRQDWDEIEAALDQKLSNMTEEQRQQLSRTAKLFPDELVESDIGEVPKGWRIDSVFNQAEYINGAAFRGSDFSKSKAGLPVIKIAELKSGITDQTKFTEKEVDDKYHIDSGDVLFSWSGNPDTSIDIFIWEGGPGLLNQHIFKIESDSKTRKVFNYYFLKSMLPFFKRTAANKQTTGLGHVTQRDLKRKKVVIPPEELIKNFSKQAKPIFDKIFNNLMETENLSSLRDTLLPKLISGEVGV